jgi:ATP-dependent Lhr-like helicase
VGEGRRTRELSAAALICAAIETRLGDRQAAVAWLLAETGVDRAGAEQLVAYMAETTAVLGRVPTQQTIVAERFFDESGGMQLVVHAPFGSRINRAWGLALRKRFCLTFDFELQAAATDDGIVLLLGEQHSFPLESVFAFVRTATMEEDLVQALLASPMFTNRWRWNATRSLALLRHSGGRRVPMPIQRMRADDLLAAVFPDQVGCQDNRMGSITPPDHPLVNETVGNCLREAMDLDGLHEVIAAIERGEIRTVAVDTPAPSPISHEILNANPYAFLDDAPLEERRARAVALRRTDPDLARGIGALDPAAIADVSSNMAGYPERRRAPRPSADDRRAASRRRPSLGRVCARVDRERTRPGRPPGVHRHRTTRARRCRLCGRRRSRTEHRPRMAAVHRSYHCRRARRAHRSRGDRHHPGACRP